MNPVKKILCTLAIIIIVTTSALWVLTQTVTPESVKASINKQLSEITSQTSHIAGTISWQLFPRPGLKITHIHVGVENNNNDSIYIDHLLLNLQITPLLRGHLVFNELKIDGLNITINPAADPHIKHHREPGSATTTKVSDPDKIPAQFSINRFFLTRGQLVILQPQNNITLSGLQIRATQLNLNNHFFPLQLKGALAAKQADNKYKATLNYNGRIRLVSSVQSNPLAALQQTAIDGQLRIKNLRLNRFKVTKVNTIIKTTPGEVTLNPFNMSLYSGESVGNLKYKVGSKQLAINQTATNLDAKLLFHDLLASNLVNGSLDLSIHATTTLQHGHWQKNLQGNGSLTIKDGTLYFINLNKLMSEAANKIHTLLKQKKDVIQSALQQPPPNPTAYPEGDTKFQLLSIQYHILDAKLINNALLLQTDKLQLKGSGEVNLNDATEELNLSAKLTTNDDAVNTIQQLLGGSFPLKVSGPIQKPQILADKQALNPVIYNYILKRAIEKPFLQIKNQLKTLLSNPENLFYEYGR